MGFFSWIGGKVSSGIKKAKEVVSNAASKVKETASNMWSSFTGEKVAKEAKERLEAAKARFAARKKEFDQRVEEIVGKVNRMLEEVNNKKNYVFEYLLKEYGEITKRIMNLNITSTPYLDKEFTASYNMELTRLRKQVIKIDFDQNRVKNNLKAIFTLGFLTRKRAKESLAAVEEVEYEVEQETGKMRAEVKRLELIMKNFENIVHYFNTMIDITEKVLERLRHSFNMLKNIHLVFSFSFKDKKLDAARLPKLQQKTFATTHNFLSVLIQMSKTQYINADFTVNEEEMDKIKIKINECEKGAKLAV